MWEQREQRETNVDTQQVKKKKVLFEELKRNKHKLDKKKREAL